ncbi:hypothetical protein CFter6_3746 [Collimonas fungivorans]|uniref:Uncharacterized protein n=1 Tax=Collimonas fungivorans TaxID=158899 RepID=A0A127PEX4_9BURK|nr:hypothetical protein CFter6_3746 [Collimonas fungivorans]
MFVTLGALLSQHGRDDQVEKGGFPSHRQTLRFLQFLVFAGAEVAWCGL